MAYFYGNTISSHWRAYGLYTTSTSNTSVTITLHGGFQSIGWGYDLSGVTCTVTNNGTSKSGTGNVYTSTGESKNVRLVSDNVVTIARGTSAKTVTLKVTINRSSASYHAGTSTGSVTVTIPALPSYTVSYNANGHGTAPAAQTKYYNTTLALRGAISATGYTFKGWATSASGAVAYAAGANYTVNSGVTLYAIWQAVTYSVTYNANGGSGAPASQTKTYGVTLTLRSELPTRTGFTFIGWATTNSATTAAYQPGGSYTANSAVTLYAVWVKAYNFPVISDLAIVRATVTVDPNTQVVTQVDDDEGTDMHVSFAWSVDADSDPKDGEVRSITIKWKPKGTSNWGVAQTVTPGGTTSGTVDAWFNDADNPLFAQEQAYDILVTITDNHDMVRTVQDILSTVIYVFDVAKGGRGMSIGKPIAPDGTGLQVAWDASFDGNVTIAGCLNITNTNDASPTLDNGPALVIGPRHGIHIEIDQNEILAKESATTGSPLYVGDPAGGKTTQIGGAPIALNSTGAITVNNWIHQNNNMGYRIKNTSGADWNAVTLNSGNEYTFGNGGYSASTGSSYFDGNWVRIRTKNKVTINGKAPIKYTSMEKAIGNVSAGAGWQASVVATAQSGYTCVGIVGFNMTHNQAGAVGKVILTVSSRTCSASGSNWGSNWTGTNNFHWDILWIANELL